MPFTFMSHVNVHFPKIKFVILTKLINNKSLFWKSFNYGLLFKINVNIILSDATFAFDSTVTYINKEFVITRIIAINFNVTSKYLTSWNTT